MYIHIYNYMHPYNMCDIYNSITYITRHSIQLHGIALQCVTLLDTILHLLHQIGLHYFFFYTHASIHTWPSMQAHMHQCLRKCIHAYIHTFIHPCVNVCISACMHTYTHTYTNTTYVRTYVHTYASFHFISFLFIALHCIPLHCIALHTYTPTYITYNTIQIQSTMQGYAMLYHTILYCTIV